MNLDSKCLLIILENQLQQAVKSIKQYNQLRCILNTTDRLNTENNWLMESLSKKVKKKRTIIKRLWQNLTSIHNEQLLKVQNNRWKSP